MNQFNLGNFLNKFINSSLLSPGGRAPNPPNSNISFNGGFQLTQEALKQGLLQKSTQSALLNTFNPSALPNLKMNNLANLERGLYIKDLMNLPKEMQEILVMIQNKTTVNEGINKLLTTNINLSTLAELLQTGGKEAMNKLVLVMANAAKQGITDTSQIKDTIRLINASVSVADLNNQAQVLKSLMLLYLPWLPLQAGVDFDFQIESSEREGEDSETIINIMISTRNYGNVRVTLILPERNSVNIIINCCEKFPKEELLKRINMESKNHSIQSNVMFEQKETKNNVKDENATHQAKISMSNLKEVNPFLLLMANAVIKHTIDLDNLAG